MKEKNFAKINIIYFIALCMVCVWFILGYTGIIRNDILSTFLIQIVTMLAVPLLLYTLFCSKSIKKTFSDTGFKKISSKMVIISILLGVVLYFLNGYVASFFQGLVNLLGWENLYQKFYTSTTQFTYKLLLQEIILSCVLPAICEEFIHRGIMLHANKKYNPRLCLYLSSLLFGLIHLNIYQFFYAAILGFIMGYVTLIADSIYPSMIIHFLNNFLSTYIYYGVNLKWKIPTIISLIQTIFSYNLIIYVISTVSAVTLIAMIIVALIQSLKKEKARQDIKQLNKNLQKNNIPFEEAKAVIDNYNLNLQKSNKYRLPNGKKPKFTDSVFLISSVVLGGIITLSTFIWGII